MTRNTRKNILIFTALAITGATFLFQPVAQDLSYHRFADTRVLWGIPNFADVVSNLPFFFAACLGLVSLGKFGADRAGRAAYFVFFAGVGATAFGSGYYHWTPSNQTLLWDRLPMTLAFAGFFASLAGARVSPKLTLPILGALLVAGLASVLYWAYSERIGAGDLRPYALVQFGMIFLAILILILFRGARPPTRAIMILFVSYVLAKIFEALDPQIFALTNENISGHTLKHLISGLGCMGFAIGARSLLAQKNL